MAKLALIPARGGSKRLPRKNALPFLGRPMLAYSVEAALRSGCFDRVLVSTDDDEIARLAADCGAEVDRRPPALGSDTASVAEVCLELLDREAAAGRTYRQLCVLYATAPLRDADDIRAVMGLLQPGHCDFSIAATTYTHYPYQALRYGEDGAASPMWPELCNRPSREFGALVAGNGSTYAVDVEAFRREREFYGTGMRAHLMPFARSVDIDTLDDFRLAECLARGLMGYAPDTAAG
ncbi:acylneuraminate cytidylyltransferase family protein [Chromobacterium phragmitis]|uniref:Acylneuraminate cytidylyltransferase family protein n=1 Tax=Chromobacterium phragmitis TaxID=2202141 RepID=A0ABV0IZM4_9NEIS